MGSTSLRLVTQNNNASVTDIGFKNIREDFFTNKRKVISNKTFNITNANTGSGVYVLHAELESNASCTGSSSPIFAFNDVSKNSLHKSITNLLKNVKNNGKNITFSNNFSVISIPLLKFWYGIKPDSMALTYGGSTYSSSFQSSTYGDFSTGHIFYKHGFIIVENTNLTETQFNLSYKSTVEFEEQSILCEIGKNDFNYSTQLGSTLPKDIGHDLYFTKIYLYNDNHDLLAIAKLSTPMRKSKKTNFYVNVKFDVYGHYDNFKYINTKKPTSLRLENTTILNNILKS